MFYGEKNGKAILLLKGEDGTFKVEIYSRFFKYRLFASIEYFYWNFIFKFSL